MNAAARHSRGRVVQATMPAGVELGIRVGGANQTGRTRGMTGKSSDEWITPMLETERSPGLR